MLSRQAIKPFSPYNLFYYCSRCGLWVLKGDAKRDGMDRPVCPKCGSNLRTSPRKKRNKVRKNVT